MTSFKNHKKATELVAISAIAAVLVVSAIAIGSGRIALAQETVTKNLNNTGVNVQTSTSQKQQCDTSGGQSPITGSCTASTTHTVTQSGGILKK
jgi:hypothetical protein